MTCAFVEGHEKPCQLDDKAIDGGHVPISSLPLKPDVLKVPLRECGYRRDLLRSDFAYGEKQIAALVGFAQLPTDSRSACLVVLGQTHEPRKAVEACRPLAAPLVFVCYDDTLQWWKQGTTSAEWLESISESTIDRFFQAHQDEFSPEAVYRAKTLGRVRSEYQLSFVDTGVMPLVEDEVGNALSGLIARNVSALKKRLGWDEVSSKQGQWLLQTVFWLVSGKILRDKQVPHFEDLALEDVDDVFYRVAKHYGTEPFTAGSRQKRDALAESARTIDRFASFVLTTTEALAHVYENTLISKQTRSTLGTHSTPSYLVDYVIGHLADWIKEIPENDRSVYEPACGHAAFLVSAMRLLTHLLPPEKSVPSRRGPYLRSRLHGNDRDSFALELARLSLTLTDIPNPDGWDLRNEDMFVGERLAEQVKGNTILLANPPFANFEDSDLRKYRSDDEKTGLNKAAEMLRRTLPELSEGSVFGVVVPANFLHGQHAESVRRMIVERFELREISLFPDKVFDFSDSESAILLGRRGSSKTRGNVRYRRVREREMDGFRVGYSAPSTQTVPQDRFDESVHWDLRVPDLEDVWLKLSDYPQATTLATVSQGLIYHSKELPDGVRTFSETTFPGAKRGYVRFEKGLKLHELPKLFWMNLDDEAIRRPVGGTTTGQPQILLNYSPVSRGPWRLKALIDPKGHATASTFISVRPQQCSLKALWALLNSPIANAYAFCHLGKRHNIVGDMRKIPMPKKQTSFEDVEIAAATYLDAAKAGANSKDLYSLMANVDAEVLRLYDLPIELEQAVLSLFTGWERVGVSFEQTRFLPQELEGRLHYADFVTYEASWQKTNRRRSVLIKKDVEGNIEAAEEAELEELQAYADYRLEQVAPRPTCALDELEDLLFSVHSREAKGA
jgi:hypothetical protein